jgi:hypothetical protein
MWTERSGKAGRLTYLTTEARRRGQLRRSPTDTRGESRISTPASQPSLLAVNKRATSYLLSKQDRAGFWNDFDTLAGPSDEWVTAYVGSGLAENSDALGKQAASVAWRALCRRRWYSGSWGFNRLTPPDADSTVWGLQLAARIGAEHSARAARARRFLARHLLPDGSLVTYARSGPIRQFTRLNRGISFEGWCSSHTCVTAAAASLEPFQGHEQVLAFLRRSQAIDGSWPAYWWADRAYSTGLAAQGMAQSQDRSDQSCLRRAVTWAANQILTGGSGYPSGVLGSAFATSYCLMILTCSNNPQSVRLPIARAVGALMDGQRADGSWGPSAALRIPPPSVQDPDSYPHWQKGGRGGGSIQLDRNAIFTTASVLRALNRLTTHVV